jgi:hypothetical protein
MKFVTQKVLRYVTFCIAQLARTYFGKENVNETQEILQKWNN